MNSLKKIILGLSLVLTPSLSNALEFHFERDASIPLVYVTAAFRGGATQDPEGKNGLTEIMGSLMLRGTKNKTKQQIDLALDQMGGSMEFETRAEFIAFRGAVLSENLPAYLSLLSEVLTAPSFREQELDKLKKEESSQLLDELAQDQSLIRLRFEEVFFKGHPYAKPNSGKIKDIQSLNVADLQKHYQKLINQNQMLVLGTGDANESDFNGFNTEIKTKRNSNVQLTAIPEFTGSPKKLRMIIFDKPDRTQTQVLFGQKGVSISDPQNDALALANYAFGGGSFQARLMTELRVKRGWTYGAYSSFKFGSKAHSWKVSFFPKNADTPPAIKVAYQMIRDLKRSGITAAEFSAAKHSLLNSAGFSYNTPQKRLENSLMEEIYALPKGYFKDMANRLSKLTLEQVNQAIEKVVTPDQMMIGIVATASTSKAEIAKALGLPESEIEVQNYQKE